MEVPLRQQRCFLGFFFYRSHTCVRGSLEANPGLSTSNLLLSYLILSYTTSSFAHHFKSIGYVKLELQFGNTQFGSKLVIFLSWVTLKFDRWPWKNNRSPLLYYIKLCAAFQRLWYIRTGVTVRKRSIRVKIGDFFVLRDLENWRMTLKNNRAPLLSNIKLCASFHRHMWIQTGVTVQKRLNGIRTSVTLTFDLDLLHGHYVGQW